MAEISFQRDANRNSQFDEDDVIHLLFHNIPESILDDLGISIELGFLHKGFVSIVGN